MSTAAFRDDAVPYLEVRCADCGWQWIAVYLPMPIGDAGKIMKTAHCPKCAAPAKRILVFWDRNNPPAPKRPLLTGV